MFNSRALSGGLLLLAAVLATSACDRAQRYTDQEYVQKAKDFQSQGKLNAALIELKNALQKNPKNSEARWRLAEVYVSQGLGEPAENELKKAKELGMDTEALKIPMGQALLLQGLYARVLAEIQPGPQSPPENVAKILEIDGRAHHGLLHFDEGCKVFAEAVKKDPRYVPSYWGLARCAAARDKLDEARMELKKAIELEEKNSGTWVQMGDLEGAVRRLPEAESAYANALKYKSDNLDALLGRAAIRIDNNELAEASKDIEAASKISSDHPIVNHLRGVVQFKQGKLGDAQASFETVLKTHPNYLPAVGWLGATNLARKNYQQAATQFAQYTQSAPNPRVQALLGLAQAKLGRRDEAEETLKALRKLDIADPQSLVVLSQAHMTLGDTDLAATYMAKAVAQNPEAADLRVGLASALSKKGERGQAIAQLENAIHLDPGMVDADALLIQTLIREKQFDKALNAVESLEKKQPKNPATFILKGIVYLAKSDFANARKSFEQALELDATSFAATSGLAQLDVLEKNPEAARQRFNAILAKDKTNAPAMMGLAGVAAATGQESEYVAWLEKAAQAEPSAVRPRVLLANYYLQKKDVQRALTMAREAQTANPSDAQALDLLGTAQLAAGERESAVVTYGKLALAIPTNPVAHYKLATAQAGVKKFDAAKVSLKKALALKPDYLDAEILLVSAELGMGHYQEAMTIAQQIQKQQPESPAGLVLQGDVLMAQKQFAPALKAYEKALAINNDIGSVVIKMHYVLSEGGNAKEADARLVRWLKDHPGDVAVRAYLASSYTSTAQNKQAIEQYQVILQNDSKNILALNNLAWLYQQEKDPRALATAEQAYLLRPDSADIMDTLGWILVEQGDTARGLKLLKAASEKAPASTSIRYHWAAALAKSGDKAGARRELADLLTKNKNFPQRQEAQELLRQL